MRDWIVALVFFASMIGLWLEPLRQRHGYVRAVAVAGAAALAVAGFAFVRARPGFTLLCYWLPAVLAMGSALLLTRAHRNPDADPLSGSVIRRLPSPDRVLRRSKTRCSAVRRDTSPIPAGQLPRDGGQR